ncbi:MAG: Protoheme IX farnesyltransferase [Chlamydiales bacterium]|nr:Protoheme IX farnesyltransferase [Chlamydiales bacterium]MCH9635856.1 Protoheme IX farnesyltransferase [Chlamydiales bacterium]MCH9703570.1 heme o synthase [Chlamydiota bacterium]
MDAVKTYTLLTKPGIVMGNVIAIAGGFALGVTGKMPYALLLATMVGLSLIIASSCILNNYIDRKIDALMERTKKRGFVQGDVNVKFALFLATILGICGISILAHWTNPLTVGLALFGYITYIVLYGFYKRRTHYGTLVGSLAGAIPPVVGYTAASGRFDWVASLLFVLLIVWQMPHFFAISLYRLEDYKRAGLPVHPVAKGIDKTKIQMLLYVLLFTLLCLPLIPIAGPRVSLVLAIICLAWILTAIRGFWNKEYAVWARSMFFASLWAVCGLFISLIVLK